MCSLVEIFLKSISREHWIIIFHWTCSCDINFNCNISNEQGVNRLVNLYVKETNNTIKLKYKKEDKHRSIFNVKATHRSHHGTRYEGTYQLPFQITFKVLKDLTWILVLVIYLSNITLIMQLILLKL